MFLESISSVLVFKALFKAYTTLDVDHIDLAITRGQVRLSMPLVLSHGHTTDPSRLEHTLVHHFERAIDAGVHFEVLGCLHADCLEKLILNGVDGYPVVVQIKCFVVDLSVVD